MVGPGDNTPIAQVQTPEFAGTGEGEIARKKLARLLRTPLIGGEYHLNASEAVCQKGSICVTIINRGFYRNLAKILA